MDIQVISNFVLNNLMFIVGGLGILVILMYIIILNLFLDLRNQFIHIKGWHRSRRLLCHRYFRLHVCCSVLCRFSCRLCLEFFCCNL